MPAQRRIFPIVVSLTNRVNGDAICMDKVKPSNLNIKLNLARKFWLTPYPRLNRPTFIEPGFYILIK